MKAKLASILVFLTIFLFPILSFSSNKNLITGAYSSMAYGEDSGDLSGIEILILFNYGTYYAVIQYAQGESFPPTLVELKIDKSNYDKLKIAEIEFIMPDSEFQIGEYTGKFRGSISADRIIGIFEKTKTKVELKRIGDFWREY
jgi:hypothetical protein